MKLIRHGVFETNSSSCHTLAIHKNYRPESFHHVLPSTLNVTMMDICLDVEMVENRIDYAWSFFTINKDVDHFVLLMEVLQEHGVSFVKVGGSSKLLDINQLLNSAIDFDDIPCVDDYYIDHQSEDILYCFLSQLNPNDAKNALEQFLFNPNILVFSGTDNLYPQDWFVFDDETRKTIKNRFRNQLELHLGLKINDADIGQMLASSRDYMVDEYMMSDMSDDDVNKYRMRSFIASAFKGCEEGQGLIGGEALLESIKNKPFTNSENLFDWLIYY